MSILIWVMVGIAIWHFAVLVPDRFWGGIIGAFLAALLGAIASGIRAADSGDPAGQPTRMDRGVVAGPRLAPRADRVLPLRGSPRAHGG